MTDSIEELRAFRNALGTFATGVTVITTLNAQGQAVGLTANSFSSVSLQPKLVLWSLAKQAGAMEAFLHNEAFNIHVLSLEQKHLSQQFSSPLENRFEHVKLEPNERQIPLLTDCVARFQCVKRFAYEGGDHMIFVGEVIQYDHSGRPPLLYVAGKYARYEWL